MNLKFKDYLCIAIPALLVLLLYGFIIVLICAILDLSGFASTIIVAVSTIILSYPGINLMIEYFNWYYKHVIKHKKKNNRGR